MAKSGRGERREWCLELALELEWEFVDLGVDGPEEV